MKEAEFLEESGGSLEAMMERATLVFFLCTVCDTKNLLGRRKSVRQKHVSSERHLQASQCASLKQSRLVVSITDLARESHAEASK